MGDLRHRGSLTQPEPELRLDADPDVRIIEGGRVLMGGTPFRALRMSEVGARRLTTWFGGSPVAHSVSERALAKRLVDAGMAHPTWASSPFGPADVTVIIPVRDDHDGLDRTVRAVADSGVAAIVVVDDGSASPVSEIELGTILSGADGPSVNLQVVRHASSLGPGAARNTARSRVETPLIAFIDADVTTPAGWLDPLLAHFNDPGVMAVAPRVRAGEGAGLLDRYEQDQSPLDLGPTAARVQPRSRVSYVPSACLVARRTIPQFDEALRYGEDVDLIWRIVAAGGTVRYEPSSTVRHRNRSDVAALVRQRVGYGSAAGPLGVRHPKAIAPVIVSKWSAAVWGLVGVGQPALGAATAGASIVALRRLLSNLPNPTRQAAELVTRTQISAVRQLADASTRTWWPLSVAASLVSRRARRIVGLCAMVPKLMDWAKTRPNLDPVRYIALRLIDDVSYGTGVWKGCRDADSITALVPLVGQASQGSTVVNSSAGETAVHRDDRSGDT